MSVKAPRRRSRADTDHRQLVRV